MSTSAPQTLPPGRYGPAHGPGRRRLGWVVGGLVAGLALAWLVWAGLGEARDEVRWSPVGFVLQGDTSVAVTYDVGKDPGASVVCSLRALDRYKSAVGIAEVTVGPSTDRVTRRTDTVRTSAQAVSGFVRSCRPVGADR